MDSKKLKKVHRRIMRLFNVSKYDIILEKEGKLNLYGVVLKI